MDNSVKKYIKEEKDISSYKLSILKKGASKKYKARLIAIEKDLIEYPFEDLGFKSVEEARAAIMAFRENRAEFFENYRSEEVVEKNIQESDIDILHKKIAFYEERYKKIIDSDIKKLNIVENDFIRKISEVSDKFADSHGIDTILAAEGAYASKCRARIQIIMYCIARYLHSRVSSMKVSVYNGMSNEKFAELNRSLDDIFKGFRSHIYGYYNEGIEKVPVILNGTIGHNSFVNSTYPLTNIFEKFEKKTFFKRLLPEGSVFFDKRGKPIKKKYISRGFGIKTPISRVGSESIGLLYIDVWSDSGVRLTELIESDFFNLNLKGSYYKAVSSIPVWDWNRAITNPYLLTEIGELIQLDDPTLYGIDCSIQEIRDAFNSCSGQGIAIDESCSKALIPATRSEASHIAKAEGYINIVCEKIQDEFNSIFANQAHDV